MAYTDIDKPSDYFETILYSGNGSTQSITSLDFQPDWCWLKARAGANVSNHRSVDSVRGATKELFQDATAAEETNTNGLTAFNSNGFSLGSSGGTNNSNTTYASWNWKAGTSFTNDASSTGVGSIDSAGSVSTDAGFSIIAWNGNDGTIAHGLGVKPAMIIIKSRQTSNNWVVFHKGLGTMSASSDSILILNGNAAKDDPGAGFSEPTTSVFTIKGGAASNDNNIGYVFAEKQGYSKFGSYTGNGNADGPYIHLGFKPAFVIFKDTATRSWYLMDNKRDPENVVNIRLFPDAGDGDSTGLNVLDFLSNGIKIKTNDVSVNASGNTYTFISFAENPFVTSTGVPATAR